MTHTHYSRPISKSIPFGIKKKSVSGVHFQPALAIAIYIFDGDEGKRIKVSGERYRAMILFVPAIG